MMTIAEQGLHRLLSVVPLAPAQKFRPRLEQVGRQGISEGLEDGPTVNQQGRQFTFLPLGWGTLNQIPPQIAYHKVTDGKTLAENPLQKAIDATGGNGVHAALDQQDAAPVRAHTGGFFKDPHIVALPMQEHGQKESRASRPHDGNAERLADHRHPKNFLKFRHNGLAHL